LIRTAEPILSNEERDILVLVSLHPNSKHLSNEEISQRMGIPVNRVKTLLHQACVKTGADNRNEAVLLAMRRGEIDLNELISLNELADILVTLDPSIVREIAELIRQRRTGVQFPKGDEQIILPSRRQSGLLTNRERDVLILVSKGYTNQEIADTLFVTPSAVRTFLNRAFKKLGASKKADALQAALKIKEISFWDISSKEELTFYLAPFGADAIEQMADLMEKKSTKTAS
jgi:DNA-binding CsgD family transcriptional regulator